MLRRKLGQRIGLSRGLSEEVMFEQRPERSKGWKPGGGCSRQRENQCKGPEAGTYEAASVLEQEGQGRGGGGEQEEMTSEGTEATVRWQGWGHVHRPPWFCSLSFFVQFGMREGRRGNTVHFFSP